MTSFTVKNFSLSAIAESGQVFTWHPIQKADATSYLIASGHQQCVAQQTGKTLSLSRPDGSELSAREANYWHHYLALDDNYALMQTELIASGLLKQEVLETQQGIRVLYQNWWDVAVSFVISQNSSITRIQHTMDLLMKQGNPIGCVPTASRLLEILGDETLCAALKLGYRKPYLESLATQVVRGWQPLSLSRPYAALSTQMAEFQTLRGIGPKVASCICLYGLGYLEAVPRDTWIKKAERDYGFVWHERLGGVQQQFVFAWMREHAKR
ncbi:DNA glycosylase [Olegusella massiliensis]|uniref:DNA glycosylase n=1 Tax=Olegusella massiliensis TaxID=1776381 RepID=UPI0003AE243A|nr:DNA glycosylase [Olegusella massiliensis]ERL11806.1 8-oxoguanine DNA glycosylase, N-terminal domain protein [Coriobacteriaceae bacterium BV3Ac1]